MAMDDREIKVIDKQREVHYKRKTPPSFRSRARSQRWILSEST